MNARFDYLRSQLPDIGDGLSGAFETLYRAPEGLACEVLAERLVQAAAHVLNLAAAIQAGEPPRV